MLAAVAGALLGPITSVQVGMGEDILILVLVCIVIGGIGSIRGALVGALLVGMVDTAGGGGFCPLLRPGGFPAPGAPAGGPPAGGCLFWLRGGGGGGRGLSPLSLP